VGESTEKISPLDVRYDAELCDQRSTFGSLKPVLDVVASGC